MQGQRVELPACGLFLGNGVYPTSEGYYLCALVAHRSWSPATNSPQEMIQRIVDENQGNLAQVWGYSRGSAPAMLDRWFYALDEIGLHVPDPDWQQMTFTRKAEALQLTAHEDRFGAGLLRFIRMAAQRGIYTAFIYTSAHETWSGQLQDMQPWYLGYDFGERFHFGFDSKLVGSGPGQVRPEQVTLPMLVDDLMSRVKAHVNARRDAGWGNIAATSSDFHVDMQIAAGANIPMIEDFAFQHLNFSSSLARGLYRQFDLPMWGSHLAHEHYSWIPWQSRYKFPLLRAALYQKYMAGAKMIVNESGNWFVEASLCEDSPKFDLPVNPLTPAQVSWGDEKPFAFGPYIEEAKKHAHKTGPDSLYCRSYRKEISDFYDYVKAHGTPQGQPEATIAIAKGHGDLSSHKYDPNHAVGGMYDLADINPLWRDGQAERSWEIVKDVFMPLRPVMGPFVNHFISGTPWGMVDIVSFVKDMVTSQQLARYKALLFSGWNTCSAMQYQTLVDYVSQGGTLFLALPHLSTNVTRNCSAFGADELVHQGDLSALCGVRVREAGRRIYWAVPAQNCDELGVRFPRRFGILAAKIGRVDITDPASRALVVDDELGEPVLIHRKLGSGQVYFLNTWAYPGGVNTDDGPGARTHTQGLVGTIYQHIAKQCRAEVWITDDGHTTGDACAYICFAVFEQGRRICLQNVDFDNPRACFLHRANQPPRRIELKPLEFLQLAMDDA